MTRPLVALLSVFTAVAVAAPGPDPSALLAQVREAYQGVRVLSARFVQTSRLVAVGVDREATGTAWFGRGGRMRWTYDGDDPQEIVSDGVTLWIHQVRDRTVIRQPLADLPASSRIALDLLGGFDGVERAFTVGSCGPRCIELTPRDEQPDLARVRVELAPDRPEVAAVVTEDALGNRNRIAFEDVRQDPPVPDGVFRFEVPDGVRIVDGGRSLR